MSKSGFSFIANWFCFWVADLPVVQFEGER